MANELMTGDTPLRYTCVYGHKMTVTWGNLAVI